MQGEPQSFGPSSGVSLPLPQASGTTVSAPVSSGPTQLAAGPSVPAATKKPASQRQHSGEKRSNPPSQVIRNENGGSVKTIDRPTVTEKVLLSLCHHSPVLI